MTPRMLALASEPVVRCPFCRALLARLSAHGPHAGVYPVEGVRMEWERGRVTLFCPTKGCSGQERIQVVRPAA